MRKAAREVPLGGDIVAAAQHNISAKLNGVPAIKLHVDVARSIAAVNKANWQDLEGLMSPSLADMPSIPEFNLHTRH